MSFLGGGRGAAPANGNVNADKIEMAMTEYVFLQNAKLNILIFSVPA
jgi:hypothetical protein